MPEPEVRLDFVLSGDDGVGDAATADETELRYDFLLGDLVLEIGDADLSARWGWVPLLDAAIALHDLVHDLETDDDLVFGFTENDATIRFSKEDGRVRVIASYGDDMVAPLVPLEALRGAVDAFARAVCAAAVDRAPAVRGNEEFRRLTAGMLS